MEPSQKQPEPATESRVTHYLQWSNLGKTGILRYMVGTILVLTISLFFGQVFSAVGNILIHAQTPAATIIKANFFGFVFSFLLIPVVAQILHRRPWWSIAMPFKRVNLRHFFIGLSVVLIVQATLSLVSYVMNPQNFQYSGADWSSWLPMLFISFVAFFVQAGTEEMVYRGYLTQFAHRMTGNRLVILLIPAIVFSAPHYGNISDVSGILALLPYFILGLMLGWLAFRSGSLWMPLGAHLANNWFVTMFVGNSKENLQKISLFMTSGQEFQPAQLTLSLIIFSILVILLAEFFMHRSKQVVPLPPQDRD
jgi:membrane protease YdiL (CAAX protease family)